PGGLHWGGADFCAVRGSLKTPGPIRSPGSCSWLGPWSWLYGAHLLCRSWRFHVPRLIVEPPHLNFPVRGDMTPIDAKRTLRDTMRAWRGGLTEAERRDGAAGVLEQFRRERPIETPTVVSGFWPMAE